MTVSSFGALVLLAIQSSAFILLLRFYKSTQQKALFLNTSAVYITEQIKLLISLMMIVIQSRKNWVNELADGLALNYDLAIPAAIFSIQNNLIYFAGSNMDAGTFQITNQFKILTTAVFMVFLMNKIFTKKQWLALIILVIGLAIAQVGSVTINLKDNKVMGLVSMTLATTSSGYASVLMEKIMKRNDCSIWIINFHLSAFSILFCWLIMFVNDGRTIYQYGLTVGYNIVVCLIILNQAIGGMLVAIVVKKFNNIVKAYAVAVSILITVIASFAINKVITLNIIISSVLVITSIIMYST